MNDQPLPAPIISVLMVAYNTEAFIAEAIESVLASTFRNFELVVVDDLSGDNTFIIASSYAEKDSRVIVHRNEKNVGDYHNRNLAAAYARGRYIKYLDSDDTIYPHSLQIMLDAMELYPEAVLGIQQQLTDDETPYPILQNPGWVIKTHFLQRGILNSGPSGSIFKRETFNRLGGFTGKRFVGDVELWIKMASQFPIVLLQPSLVWWRIHPAQQSSDEKKDANMMLVRYKLSKSFLSSGENPLSEADKKHALKKLNRRHLVNIVNIYLKKFRMGQAFTVVKASKLGIRDILNAIIH